MSICRLFLRSLGGRLAPLRPPQALSLSLLSCQHETSTSRNLQDGDFHALLPRRTFAFSSAEEAAAERRRRKRRLRIEPPLHALRRDNYPPPPRDPNAPRLPDSTSALVGPRLNLHNRVQSLIRASDLDAASAVARHSVFSNTRPTVFTCNAIIAAMYRAKRYSDAIALFQFFFNQSNIVPNIVSYNNLINAHCDEGRVDVGLDIYRHIIANAPFSPSSVTYRHLTKGLIDAGRIGEAVDLLREMLNKGHGADSLVYNNLISGFLNLENLDKANELFDELKERCLVYDGVVNATFMDWFFNKGKNKEAMESYKSLLDRQFKMIPATCNVLLEVLLKHGKKSEALVLFDQMLDNHTPPTFQAVNSDTFNIMVNECFKLGMFSEAIETFRKVGTQPKSKPFSMDVAGYNNIISKFCEHRMLSEAETFFEELCSKSLSPDVPTHRTLIDAYIKANKIDDALRVFNRMVDVGLRVVASFGNRVFEELIRNGKAADCAQILTKMGEKEPKPDPTCYDVVIRGLGNENLFDLSRDLLEQMMRYGIGVTPALREFLNEAFGRVGRAEEIESLVNMNRWGYVPYRPSSGPPRSNQQTFPPSQGAQHRNTPAGPRMGGLGFQSQGQKTPGFDNSPSTLSGLQMGESGFSSQQQMSQSVHNSQPTSAGIQMGGSGFSFQEQMTPSTQNFPSAPGGYQTGGSGYPSPGQGDQHGHNSPPARHQMGGSGFPPQRQMTHGEYNSPAATFQVNNSPAARFQAGGLDFQLQGQMTQDVHNNSPAGFQGQMTPGVHNYSPAGYQIGGSGFPSQGQVTQVVHNFPSTTSEFSDSHQPSFEFSESTGLHRIESKIHRLKASAALSLVDGISSNGPCKQNRLGYKIRGSCTKPGSPSSTSFASSWLSA